MNAQTLTLQMSTVVEPEDDGSFHAYCPTFTELHACGSTELEAGAPSTATRMTECAHGL